MAEANFELIVEILRKMQSDIAQIKAVQAEHTQQFIRVREDIHGLRGDDLRRETMQAQMDVRLERIESRLGLRDA